MIFTSLSPNTQKDDLLLSIRVLLEPWNWYSHKLEKKFIDQFNQQFQTKNVFLFDSGRNSLLYFLKTLNLEKNDEVLLQAFTCVAVANPILQVGAKPVWIDCSKDSFNMSPKDLEKKITKNSKVLIIQHTFGEPANIEKLITIAKKHNLIIIEDCAHSLGAKHNNIYTGKFGDAAIFSFGRDKVISSTSGGLLVVNERKLLRKVQTSYRLLQYPNFFWTFQQLIHPLILSIAKPSYNFFKVGRVIIFLSINFRLISKPILPAEKDPRLLNSKPKKLPGVISKIAQHQLAKLNTYNKHRTVLAKAYNKQLSNKYFHNASHKSNESIFLRYTIKVQDPNLYYNRLIKNNIQIGTWFDSVIIPKSINLDLYNYKQGCCPNAEFYSNHCINLPNGIQINSNQTQKIVNLLKSINNQ